MNETNQTTAKQIGARELHMAKFRMSFDDATDTIGLLKGKKAMRIKYNFGSDLYDVTKIKINGLCDFHEEQLNGLYCDQLRETISDHFKFEYVMEQFMGASRNSLFGAIQAGDKEKVAELEQKAKNGETILLVG